jgi:putative membrane protein
MISGCRMTYLTWIVRAVVFILILGFAVKNDQTVTLRYFFGYQWQTSLVVVLLIFFAAGAAVGVISMLANVLRQRREMARLMRDLKVKSELARIDELQQKPFKSH